MFIERPASATDELNTGSPDVINFDYVVSMKIKKNSSVSSVHKIIFKLSGESQKINWYFDNQEQAKDCIREILLLLDGK